MTFTLDTSGTVPVSGPFADGTLTVHWAWANLPPFAQGYIAAMFEAQTVTAHCEAFDDDGRTILKESFTGPVPIHDPVAGVVRNLAFSDLAPEALAAILADCGCFLTAYPASEEYAADAANDGRYFWRDRADGLYDDFPPVRVYLDDAGKVQVT